MVHSFIDVFFHSEVNFTPEMMWSSWGNVDPRPHQLTSESHSQAAEKVAYTMYHGTSREAAASIMKDGFRTSCDGILGPGVYLSWDLETASRYPLGLPESEKVVLKVKAEVGKVLVIDRPGHPLQKTWACYDYHMACFSPDFSADTTHQEVCIHNPNRVKVSDVISSLPNRLQAEDGCSSNTEPQLESLAAPIDGKVYTMYHGTSREAAASIMIEGFRPSIDGLLGRGVYLSRDLQNASRYPLGLSDSEKVVLKVRVEVGRVIVIDRPEHHLLKTWACHGYNMAWCPLDFGPIPSGLEEDCVWNPNRVKVIGVICSKSQANTLLAEDDSPSSTEPLLASREKPTDGRVYIMYHGTSRRAAASILREGFKPSSDGILGPGVYLNRNLQKASKYPLGRLESERVVLRVRVEVGRVIVIDRPGHPLLKTWAFHGYNMAWCPPDTGTMEEDCVWNPNRIQVTGVFSSNKQTKGLWPEDDLLSPLESLLVNGRVHTMYHGTSKAAAVSILSEGFNKYFESMKGHGVYLNQDLQKAYKYPLDLPVDERVVLKMEVNVKRNDRQIQSFQKAWNKYNYDRAWCGMVKNSLKVQS